MGIKSISSSIQYKKNISIVSIPEWRGAGIHGTESAPKALRKFDLVQKLQVLGLNVIWHEVKILETINHGDIPQKVKYEDEIEHTSRESFFLLRKLVVNGVSTMVVLGGDHTVSIASVAAQASLVGAAKIGVIWIDAHGDVHTPETSPSRNAHGMPLAVLLGHGSDKLIKIGVRSSAKVYPCNVVHIGLNNAEKEEYNFFDKLGIKLFPKDELGTSIGFLKMCKAIRELGSRTRRVVLSVDMDVFDRSIAPGVHFQNDNGITEEQFMRLAQYAKCFCNIVGVDITEIVKSKDQGLKTIALACRCITGIFA